VYVGEVVPKDAVTKDLFEEPETEQQQVVCELMDSINTRYGKNTLCFAASKLGKSGFFSLFPLAFRKFP